MNNLYMGFTGTQRGMTDAQKNTVRTMITAYGPYRVMHGMCIGADEEFDEICASVGIFRIGYPGLDNYGRSPKRGKCAPDEVMMPLNYIARNRIIVRRAHILIATPAEETEVLRSGTWSTIRYARRLGRLKGHIDIIQPNGEIL